MNEYLFTNWPRSELHIRQLRTDPDAREVVLGVFSIGKQQGKSVRMNATEVEDLRRWLGDWLERGWQ